jgi:ribonucleotide monophosphatase NagD (HAD superfamily)
MFGDRLYTDIEMANRAGVMGVLVLSGEANEADIVDCPQQPDLVVASVADMLPGV